MKYESGVDVGSATCLPPEAYIRIWKSAISNNQPRFMSSIYPKKNKNEVQPMRTENKSRR